jgi:hypothetical protein
MIGNRYARPLNLTLIHSPSSVTRGKNNRRGAPLLGQTDCREFKRVWKTPERASFAA